MFLNNFNQIIFNHQHTREVINITLNLKDYSDFINQVEYNPIEKELYIILKTKELYVIKDATRQDYNNFNLDTKDKIDSFFEEYIADKKPKRLSLSFSEFYNSR